MAGETDNKDKGAEQNKGGSNPRGGGGGGDSQRRPQSRAQGPSGMLIYGAIFWVLSALLTAIVLMLIFMKIPPACLGERGQIVACLPQIVSSTEGMIVLVAALIVQGGLSIAIFQFRHNVTAARIGAVIESIINFVGIYWLFCVQFGAAPGVYETVSTFIRTLTAATLGWWVFLIALSIAWDWVTNAFFAGRKASAQQQRR